ncbi:hypothetical protein MVEN_00268200 [Mycena venus]|uniref:Uncharacterized protein n=1 Tax=Mycena venus TaxID=2733690 RepID=A0A8H6YYH8_9AGAR|nr:hypothetical protein MVEN_00268200 [Mycena venus]
MSLASAIIQAEAFWESKNDDAKNADGPIAEQHSYARLLGVVPAPAPAADAAVDAMLMNLTTAAHGPFSFLPISLATLAKLQSGDVTLGTSPIFLPALITLIAAYSVLAPLFPSVRQHAWVLATIASALMIASSVPFVADYVWRGGVQGVQGREGISEAVNRVSSSRSHLQAYLTADMLVGFLCYRSQIGFLTGWMHHVVYIGITEVAVRCGAHIFCLGGDHGAPNLPSRCLDAPPRAPLQRPLCAHVFRDADMLPFGAD